MRTYVYLVKNFTTTRTLNENYWALSVRDMKKNKTCTHVDSRPVRGPDLDVPDVLPEHEGTAREVAAVLVHRLVVRLPVTQHVLAEGALYPVRRPREEESSPGQLLRRHALVRPPKNTNTRSSQGQSKRQSGQGKVKVKGHALVSPPEHTNTRSKL